MPQFTQRQELEAMIEMAREGIEWCEQNGEEVSDKQRAVLAQYETQLARLGDRDGWTRSERGTAMRLTDRPAGGKAHRNQYGACTVEVASEAQTRYIKSLMDERDLSALEDSVIIDVARLRMQVATNTVNKKAASAIIDRLKQQPVAVNRPVATGPRKATDKQLGLIRKLAVERDMTPAEREALEGAIDNLAVKGASATIEKLMARPISKVDIDAGVYINPDGAVYRVYFGQNSGQMLAAKVEEEDGQAHFEYAGKAERFITAASRKLSIEEAAAFGKATGTCIVCARRLDVPESVDRGIGPVCFAKMGG